MAHVLTTAWPTSAEVERRLAFADAALAVAGHEVTDPVLRDVLARAARHEITGDEAIAETRRHVQD